MRITNKMVTSQYKRNLNQALTRKNYYENRATNLRKFNSAADDTVGASKAYSARRAYLRNLDYSSNTKDLENRMLTAESSISNLNKITQEIGSSDILQAITGSMSKDERVIISTKIRKLQDAMVAELNTKYADQFLFGGKDYDTPPFSIGQKGALLYKGVNVDTGLHEGFDGTSANTVLGGADVMFGKENGDLLNGYTLNVIDSAGYPATVSDTVNKDTKVINLYIAKDPATGGPIEADIKSQLQTLANGGDLPAHPDGTLFDSTKITFQKPPVAFGTCEIVGGENPIAAGTQFNLHDMANETNYLDIGLGLSFNGSTLDGQSVFDASLTGLSFIGYGVDQNGNPQNMHSILSKMCTELEKDDVDFDFDTNFKPLMDNFQKQQQSLLTGWTNFGTKSNLITYTKERIADMDHNLNVKMKEIESVNLEDAVLDFKMAELTYMSALQMGTKLIMPTFLDYMS